MVCVVALLASISSRGHLTAYLDGRVVKRWPYQLLNK
jgi:hypothetical protein